MANQPEIPRARQSGGLSGPAPTYSSNRPYSQDAVSYYMNVWGMTQDKAILAAQDEYAMSGAGSTTGSTGPAGGSGQPSRTVSTQRSVQKFSAQQLQEAATSIAQQALGRALTKEELARVTASVNKQGKKNPTVSRTVTKYKGSNTSSSTTTKGGIDETQVMRSEIEQGDEYKVYQQASTYFNAMMSALRGPAGGGV